jgi:mRNA interferase RelE/StbE
MTQIHHKLVVPDNVLELIRGMHPHLKKKVKASLRQILVNPLAGKALKDELTGLMSFRVSRFRIVYRISQKKHVEIIAIGSRERIYEDTFRFVKRDQG